MVQDVGDEGARETARGQGHAGWRQELVGSPQHHLELDEGAEHLDLVEERLALLQSRVELRGAIMAAMGLLGSLGGMSASQKGSTKASSLPPAACTPA